jgi:hypothetical protein
VLEIAGDSVPMENTVRATATLSLKSGGPAWSRAERVVMSRGFAMDLINRLVNRLAADAGCKTRRRK